jgi:hypothetical protein
MVNFYFKILIFKFYFYFYFFRKNFLWMWRNFGVMAFIIGLPVAQIILFCLAIGHDPTGLSIAVANHELSENQLAQQDCPIYNGCNYTMLSCRYLEFLKNRSVTVVSFNFYDNEYVFSNEKCPIAIYSNFIARTKRQ